MFNYINWLLENATNIIRYHRAVWELSNLSDNELELLGLTRYTVPTEVYKVMLKNR